MKRILLTVAVVLSLALAGQAQTRLGAGLAWGSEVDDLGLGINGEFFVKNNISISPGFIFYFEDNGGFQDRDWWELNINGNFYFATEGVVDFYGIGGINLTTRSIKSQGERDGDTELGINLGIGANFNTNGAILPYTELKYIAGNYDQAVLFFGIKFPLN
ncbi:outer membrane beta-barrel protein [Fulvivirga sedimenti]|uniref:Outer membrane beta-barrel protein n=1 Tax=Fulvivirga sedimenti TaxID=2879465 RepID=A0A9X1HY33_9BACT|nr:outer membrane beta-barrel protein [Fulvivirga sedimenti]MCA6078852.1 outer membrane beta-barrel protein [Fulvivirga sedimenti]